MNANFAEAAVIVALAAWFVLSALNQIGPLSRRFARWDIFGLLPKWTFFAPNPGIFDYHLLYRVSEAEAASPAADAPGDWRQVETFTRSGAVPFLWNPRRRQFKTFSDMVNGVARRRAANPNFERVMMFSTPYLWLTHLVASRVRAGQTFQWAVVKSHGFVDRRRFSVVLLSRRHSAEAPR